MPLLRQQNARGRQLVAECRIGSFPIFWFPNVCFRQRILDTMVSQHVERHTLERGAQSDPRKSNPHFAHHTIEARLPSRVAQQPHGNGVVSGMKRIFS